MSGALAAVVVRCPCLEHGTPGFGPAFHLLLGAVVAYPIQTSAPLGMPTESVPPTILTLLRGNRPTTYLFILNATMLEYDEFYTLNTQSVNNPNLLSLFFCVSNVYTVDLGGSPSEICGGTGKQCGQAVINVVGCCGLRREGRASFFTERQERRDGRERKRLVQP